MRIKRIGQKKWKRSNNSTSSSIVPHKITISNYTLHYFHSTIFQYQSSTIASNKGWPRIIDIPQKTNVINIITIADKVSGFIRDHQIGSEETKSEESDIAADLKLPSDEESSEEKPEESTEENKEETEA